MIRIEENYMLFDIDEAAWRQVVEARGGCACHISAPCDACVEPVT